MPKRWPLRLAGAAAALGGAMYLYLQWPRVERALRELLEPAQQPQPLPRAPLQDAQPLPAAAQNPAAQGPEPPAAVAPVAPAPRRKPTVTLNAIGVRAFF